MKKCGMCSIDLGFLNTPVFGSGKLNDGIEICTDCFKRVNKIDPKFALNLKNHSQLEVLELIKKNGNISDSDRRLNDIVSEIQSLRVDNVSSFLARKEIKELPKILSYEEHLDNLVQGFYNGGNGILVSTNSRLLFVDKGLIYGLKVEVFPLDKISSIQYETGLLLGKIKIFTSGNTAVIDNVNKKEARSFSEFVNQKISHAKSNQSTSITQNDIYDQIEKLASIKEKGILTEEEFLEKKRLLLDRL